MMVRFGRVVWAGALMLGAAAGGAQTCTTQSQMQPAVRDGLAAAALRMGGEIQADDEAGLKAETVPEYAKDFGGVAGVMSSTAPHLKGGAAGVQDVYVLDASGQAGAAEAQFYCTLNKSQMETDFTIPQLPPGRYGFATVRFEEAAPWAVSLLLRQEAATGKWLLAGLYPRELTAGGHDGLWYWKQARQEVAAKHGWDAWLYLEEAQVLLQPAQFVSSTHLEKLATELTADAPPAVKAGLSLNAPLVVKGVGGAEYAFSGLGTEDAPGADGLDVAAHLKLDALGDPAAARKRNMDAAAALVAAYPELREAFHGVLVVSEVPNSAPYASEIGMGEIR